MATDKPATAASVTAPLNQSTIPPSTMTVAGKGKPHFEETDSQKKARKAAIKARRARYAEGSATDTTPRP